MIMPAPFFERQTGRGELPFELNLLQAACEARQEACVKFCMARKTKQKDSHPSLRLT